MFCILDDKKIILPVTEWMVENPIGMLIYAFSVNLKLDIIHKDYDIQVTYGKNAEEFFAGMVLEYKDRMCVRPTSNKSPYSEGSSAFLTEVLLQSLGDKHNVSNLNIPEKYIGSTSKKIGKKLVERYLDKVSMPQDAERVKALFRYLFKMFARLLRIEIPANLLIPFEEAWRRVSRKVIIKRGKKTREKLSHAPSLERIKGFTDEEKHFILNTFNEPWREVSLIRQDYKQLVTQKGTISVCSRLAELANIQWQYSDRLIALGKRRLRLLFQKKEYNLQRVRYNESLKGYINEMKFSLPKLLPEIFQPTAIVTIASRVIIYSSAKKKKSSWSEVENKEAVARLYESWTNFVKTLVEFPPLEEH